MPTKKKKPCCVNIMNFIYFHDVSGCISETFGYVKINKDEYWSVKIKLSYEDYRHSNSSKKLARKYCLEKWQKIMEILQNSNNMAIDNLRQKGKILVWDFEQLKKMKERATDNRDAVEQIKFLNKSLRHPINFRNHAYNTIGR